MNARSPTDVASRPRFDEHFAAVPAHGAACAGPETAAEGVGGAFLVACGCCDELPAQRRDRPMVVARRTSADRHSPAGRASGPTLIDASPIAS